GCALFFALVSVIFLSPAVPIAASSHQKANVLKAQAFVVVDEHGRARAVLGPDASQGKEAQPGVYVKDESGRLRLALSASDDGGAGVVVIGKTKLHQVALTVGQSGAAGLGITDEMGTSRTLLGVDDSNRTQ